MTGRRAILSHTVIVAAALGVGQVLAYAVSVVAARALGPEQFGILAALLGIILIGSVLALGIQAVAARRLVHLPEGQRDGAARVVLRNGLLGGAAVAAATAAVSPLLMWVLRLDAWLPLLLAALTLVPLTWAGAQYGVAQGRESYGRLAAIYLTVGVGRGVGGVVAALATGSVLGTMAGLALGTLAGTLAGRWIVAPLATGATLRIDHFFGETAHATHALLALFALTNIDVLLARALLSPFEAGEYGVGAIIAKVAFWLPQFVGVVMFPRFVDQRRSQATVIAIGAVGLMGIVVLLVTAALPALVVNFVGGAAYDDLIPIAWMFAAIGALFALAQALLLTRLAVDDRRAVIAVWAAAGVLVLLAVFFVPRTVAGLASSALVAGALLTLVGAVVAVAELRSAREQPTPTP